MLGGWIKLQSWRCSLAITAREESWGGGGKNTLGPRLALWKDFVWLGKSF